jgi:hypothetical protein
VRPSEVRMPLRSPRILLNLKTQLDQQKYGCEEVTYAIATSRRTVSRRVPRDVSRRLKPASRLRLRIRLRMVAKGSLMRASRISCIGSDPLASK